MAPLGVFGIPMDGIDLVISEPGNRRSLSVGDRQLPAAAVYERTVRSKSRSARALGLKKRSPTAAAAAANDPPAHAQRPPRRLDRFRDGASIPDSP